MTFPFPSFDPAVAGGDNDPNFSSVNLLCPFDTDLSDKSNKNLSWTANGNAASSSAQSKWGGGALGLDGTGDYLTASYVSGDHDWFAGDFTLECWARHTSFRDGGANSHPIIIGNMGPNNLTDYWSFGTISDGRLEFYYWNGSPNNVNSTGTLSLNTWHHIALSCNGTTIRLFIDGILDGSATKQGTPLSSAAQPLTVGSYDGTTFDGYIDDLRLTKSVGRYTANFTPPVSAFPTS